MGEQVIRGDGGWCAGTFSKHTEGFVALDLDDFPDEQVQWSSGLCEDKDPDSVCALEVLADRKKEIASEIVQKSGGFRACSRCGWVRYIARSVRRVKCSFPGKHDWQCGAQPLQAGWALCEEIPADRVAARNEAVRQAFRAVQLVREAPGDGLSRCNFLTALRAATRVALAPAHRASGCAQGRS